MARFPIVAGMPATAVFSGLLIASGAVPAMAAADDNLAGIRNEIMQLRQDYETKIRDLEGRLAKAEADAQAAQAAAAAAQAETMAIQTAPPPPPPNIPAPPAPNGSPAQTNLFNPNVSAVLNGFYSAATHDPSTAPIPGFALGEDAHGLERGFSIGESEINLNANIDPFLFGWLNLSFPNNDHVSVEEAYLQTTSLGDGLTIKAGQFFSGIAYLNEQHSHNWSFSDASLPYRAFLAGQYGDAGVQVRWLAPVNTFLEFGAEAFRGDAYPSGGAANHGMGTETVFVHTGDDINESSSWLLGLSYVHTNADRRETTNDLFPGTADVFSGSDDLGIVSLVYKWAPGGNLLLRNLILSGEFFFDREDGSFNGIRLNNYDRTGWYLQGVYQFMPRWSFGLRYAQLGTNGVSDALKGSTLDDLGHIPRAESALLEFDTSEFGRFRLQYTHDDSNVNPLDQVLLQYTIIYGPHPAHRY